MFLAQCVEVAQPLLVALASRGDAVTEPIFLHHDFASELVAVGFFLFEDGVAPGLEMGEPLIELARDAPIEPQRGSGNALQQPAVMADQHDPGFHARQLFFQPLDAGEVEVVGGLVEEQNIGFGGQNARQGGAAGLPAGQGRGVLRAGETELFEQISGAVVIGGGTVEPGLHIRQRGGKTVEVRLLRQIPDGRAGLCKAAAGIGRDRSGGHFQQGGFTGAVSPDQANAVPGGHAKASAGQQRRGAKGEVDVLQEE